MLLYKYEFILVFMLLLEKDIVVGFYKGLYKEKEIDYVELVLKLWFDEDLFEVFKKIEKDVLLEEK